MMPKVGRSRVGWSNRNVYCCNIISAGAEDTIGISIQLVFTIYYIPKQRMRIRSRYSALYLHGNRINSNGGPMHTLLRERSWTSTTRSLFSWLRSIMHGWKHGVCDFFLQTFSNFYCNYMGHKLLVHVTRFTTHLFYSVIILEEPVILWIQSLIW